MQEIVNTYKNQYDPALFYEQMVPERAQELKKQVTALR